MEILPPIKEDELETVLEDLQFTERMATMKPSKGKKECKHEWKVVDYDDTDWGLVWVECGKCGDEKKVGATKEDAKYYGKEYIGDLRGEVTEIIQQDAEAMGIDIEELNNETI